jgi:catechol 2,3-dioxygenase-like lactoylglutathione lyase family enzyme
VPRAGAGSGTIRDVTAPDPERPPAPRAVHETALYAGDLTAATRFYTEVVGLRLVLGPNASLAALRLQDGGILLLFDPDEAAVPGREVPSHGAHGPGHVAFSVDEASAAAVLDRCRARGVQVEREITWPRGGRSTYVRDPAGNSVEFIVGEIWPA